jgi:hypothetical protein
MEKTCPKIARATIYVSNWPEKYLLKIINNPRVGARIAIAQKRCHQTFDLQGHHPALETLLSIEKQVSLFQIVYIAESVFSKRSPKTFR